MAAERAKFDMVFLADGLTSSEDGHPSQIARFEPLMVLTAFAMATSRIGLAATASTTYGEPFHLARAFASLDHISHGRAAWNAVTTSYASTGANFGIKHPAHADRYAIAEEFIDVTRALWDSWDDDAFRKTRRPASTPISRSGMPSTTRAKYLGQGSAQHVAFAAGPPDHCAIRIVGARPAARGSAPPTWCSPRSRVSKARARSTEN